MLLKEEGLSLVGVLLSAVMIGGISLGALKLSDSILDSQKYAESSIDENELKEKVRLILDNEKFCRLSVARRKKDGTAALGISGTAMSLPAAVKKNNVDEDNEGIDLELYYGNPQGDQRTKLVLEGQWGEDGVIAGTQPDFKSLKIRRILLRFNNEAFGCSGNYCENSQHRDVGEIEILYVKKISKDKWREMSMRFNVNLLLSTDASNNTSVLSCSRSSDFFVPILSECSYAESLGGSVNNGRQDVECPGGKVGVSAYVYASSQLDGPVAIGCCKLKEKTPSSVITQTEQSGKGTGADNTDHEVRCSGNRFLVGYGAYASDYLDGNLEGRCAQFDGLVKVAGSCIDYPVGYTDGSDDLWQKATCPLNTVLEGIVLRAGSRLERIRSISCCAVEEI